MADYNETGAVLSKKQRQYLKELRRPEHKREYEPANPDTMRGRIRDRIRYSMMDFSLLLALQDGQDIEYTFEPSEREQFESEFQQSEHGMYGTSQLPEKTIRDHMVPNMRDAIAYFYLGLLSREGVGVEHFEELLRNAIKEAVELGEGDDVIAEIEVEITKRLREESRRELRQKFMEGEQLSQDQLELLLDSEPEVLTKYVVEELERDDS